VVVDVVVSGLGRPPSVGAFDLEVVFDPVILSSTGVTFSSFLGDAVLLEALTDFRFLPGSVELAEVSLLLSAELDALQPANFTLATLSFSALTSGSTTLTFSEITLDDAFGNLLIGQKAVPEPPTSLLTGAGLTLLNAVVSRWRRRRHAQPS